MNERTCTYYDRQRRLRCTECASSVDLCQCEDVEQMAHERLTSDDGKMIQGINQELRNARQKFPNTRHMYTALAEEFGELGQALMQHEAGEKSPVEVFKEAVQTAAMAIRVGTEGDSDFTYEPYAVFSLEKK